MSVPDAKRLKELEAENGRLKKLLAESLLKMGITREALRKKLVSAPARRDVVRFMVSLGLSERRALRVICMSASTLRYQSALTEMRRCVNALLPWHIGIVAMALA